MSSMPGTPSFLLYALLLLRCCCCPSGDFMRDFSLKLVPLLEDKVRVMIYAGESVSPKQHECGALLYGMQESLL